MKRSEKVVKNIPADFTNPDKAERWLEENAEQGLVLIRYSGRKAVFIKGEPAKTAYMVVPMDPDGMKGPQGSGRRIQRIRLGVCYPAGPYGTDTAGNAGKM